MEAHGHAVLAGIVATGAVMAVHAPVGVGAFVLAGTVAGSLLPDLDEPGSAVSRSFGVVSEVVGWVMKYVSGGHRKLTHSLLGTLLFCGLLVGVVVAIPSAMWIIAGVCVTLTIIGLLPKRLHIRHILGVVSGLATWDVLRFNNVHISIWWILVIGVGMLLHLVGDTLTPSGIMWLFPSHRHLSFDVFRTGSTKEHVLVLVGFVVLVLMLVSYVNDIGSLHTISVSAFERFITNKR